MPIFADMSRNMKLLTMWYVRPAKAQTSQRIRAVWSEPLLVAWIFYDCKATDWILFGVSKLKRRLMILFLPKSMINVTTLILKLSISHFKMAMFLALHPIESISLNSFVLLEHLAMLLNSTFAINCKLKTFLNMAICIINFAKPFQNFIDDTMIWYLNSKLDLNLSCAKDFRNLNSMVTWCINWRKLLALIIFQRSSLNYYPIIKSLAIPLLYCNRLHAAWSKILSMIRKWRIRPNQSWQLRFPL